MHRAGAAALMTARPNNQYFLEKCLNRGRCCWMDAFFSERQRRLSQAARRHQYFFFSSTSSASSTNEVLQTSPTEQSDDAAAADINDNTSRIQPPTTRNKKIANIIRDGISYLNQSAVAIQKNKDTSKNLFATPEELHGPTAKHLEEEHRLLSVAEQCLFSLCDKDPNFPLMAAGEPILLLQVKTTRSLSHADLYWALPYPILSAPELDDRQRGILQDLMKKRIQGTAGGMLKARIYSILRGYYPPKLRFKYAKPAMLQDLMEKFEG